MLPSPAAIESMIDEGLPRRHSPRPRRPSLTAPWCGSRHPRRTATQQWPRSPSEHGRADPIGMPSAPALSIPVSEISRRYRIWSVDLVGRMMIPGAATDVSPGDAIAATSMRRCTQLPPFATAARQSRQAERARLQNRTAAEWAKAVDGRGTARRQPGVIGWVWRRKCRHRHTGCACAKGTRGLQSGTPHSRQHERHAVPAVAAASSSRRTDAGLTPPARLMSGSACRALTDAHINDAENTPTDHHGCQRTPSVITPA